MTLNRMAGLWARTALLWFVATILFGMYMGVTHQFHLASPHAHMGLLGWISSALFALLYALTGEDAGGRGPSIHWAAHNLGVGLMASGMFMTVQFGESGWTALIPAGGSLIVLATLWLAARLWGRLGAR